MLQMRFIEYSQLPKGAYVIVSLVPLLSAFTILLEYGNLLHIRPNLSAVSQFVLLLNLA